MLRRLTLLEQCSALAPAALHVHEVLEAESVAVGLFQQAVECTVELMRSVDLIPAALPAAVAAAGALQRVTARMAAWVVRAHAAAGAAQPEAATARAMATSLPESAADCVADLLSPSSSARTNVSRSGPLGVWAA
jgi:hypothetical protein